MMTSLPLPAIFSGGPHIGELIVVLIIILVIFGPKQLPKIGRALGGGLKEFKDGLKTGYDEENEEDDEKPAAASGATTIEAGPAEALPPQQATDAEPQTDEQRQPSSQS